MKILGIETSCDETAVCLMEAEGSFGSDFAYKVLGNALYSQVAIHAKYGGVFPDLAKRAHAQNLVPLLSHVLADGGETSLPAHAEQLLEREPELFSQLKEFLGKHGRPDIDAIAVTYGPGLAPALWVGVNFARALATAWDMPLVGVNHLEGHIAMAAMEHPNTSQKSEVLGLEKIEFPALALLISGGHTELDVLKAWPQFETAGRTRDDAVGEAFDKAARMLGIPYPGGAELSRMASEARIRGDALRNFKASPREIRLPRPMLHEDSFEFSFSGLKTAVLRLIDTRQLSDDERRGVALEFEEAVADVLVAKTKRAADEYGARTLLVGGGVSANQFIKERLAGALAIPVLSPPAELATDNALMIALAGYFRAVHKEFTDPALLRAEPNLRLGAGVPA